MPKKITKLTKAQIARFPEWVDKWIKIGLSTEPANWEKAIEGAAKCYELSGLERPKFITVASPMEMVYAGPTACNELSPLSKAEIKKAVNNWHTYYRGGSFWASWYAYVSFLRDVCGWENESLEAFKWDEQVARNCGWWWLSRGVCVLSDRPEHIKRDEQGRLHCDDGPAIKYRDGWGVYCVHGVRVPADIIEKPITVAQIEKEGNAEIRRVMIDRFGTARYITESGAELVSQDDWGTLYKKEVPGDETIYMVKVVDSTPEPDGSYKDYWLRVDGNAYGGLKTARAAVASTWRESDGTLVFKRPEDYHPEIET